MHHARNFLQKVYDFQFETQTSIEGNIYSKIYYALTSPQIHHTNFLSLQLFHRIKLKIMFYSLSKLDQ